MHINIIGASINFSEQHVPGLFRFKSTGDVWLFSIPEHGIKLYCKNLNDQFGVGTTIDCESCYSKEWEPLAANETLTLKNSYLTTPS